MLHWPDQSEFSPLIEDPPSMLHQKDYLLRMIEQLGRILVRVRNELLGRESDTDEVTEAEIAELARGSGMELDLVRRLAPESLHLLAAPGGETDPARAWLWAEILFLDALFAERRGDGGRAGASLERALWLFRMVEPGWRPPGDAAPASERIAEIEQRLAEYGSDGR
jgi:hypothetical protein